MTVSSQTGDASHLTVLTFRLYFDQWKTLSWFWLFLIISFVFSACDFIKQPPKPHVVEQSHLESILVVPFEPAISGGKRKATVYCPICKAAFQAGVIESGAEGFITKQLMAFLKGKTDYKLIPLEVVRGIRSKAILEDITVSHKVLLTEMGKTVGADGVLSGIVYRFRQRKGTKLSVESPASVSFGIHLIRVDDARLLWSAHFDETQKTLSEDLFKLRTFVKRGGGWLSAEELAIEGLNEIMANFPKP